MLSAQWDPSRQAAGKHCKVTGENDILSKQEKKRGNHYVYFNFLNNVNYFFRMMPWHPHLVLSLCSYMHQDINSKNNSLPLLMHPIF